MFMQLRSIWLVVACYIVYEYEFLLYIDEFWIGGEVENILVL